MLHRMHRNPVAHAHRARISRGTQRRRGAVMVEGLIASALLAVFLACTVFVHHLYSAKLATMTEARREAWNGALPGCGGGLIAGILDNMGMISALSEADNHGLIDAPEFVTDMGRHTGSSTPRSVQSGELVGAGSFQLQTSTSIPCNEFAEDEDGSLTLNLFRAVRQIVPIDFD
jgi:hypothetical protein